jgi:hypothetical protein
MILSLRERYEDGPCLETCKVSLFYMIMVHGWFVYVGYMHEQGWLSRKQIQTLNAPTELPGTVESILC